MFKSNNFIKVKILRTIIFIIKIVQSADFTYTNQNWQVEFPACRLKRQSPIELWDPAYTVRKNLTPIKFENYNTMLPTQLLYRNTGHTVDIVPNKNGKLPTISGRNFPGVFELEQLHFHWGSQNNVGSEHTIRGKRYGLELHLVHKNKKYKTITEAIKYVDGLAVIGILYKVSDLFLPFNYGLGKLLFNLELMKKFNRDIKTSVSFRLTDLFQHVDVTKYFFYKGSLTTPPCSQAVTWIVMRDIESASAFQLQFFRRLVNSNGQSLSNNYRKLQKIGRRTVFSSH